MSDVTNSVSMSSESKTEFFKAIFPSYSKIMKEKFREAEILKANRKIDPIIKSLQILAREKAVTREYASRISHDLLQILFLAIPDHEGQPNTDLIEFQKKLLGDLSQLERNFYAMIN